MGSRYKTDNNKGNRDTQLVSTNCTGHKYAPFPEEHVLRVGGIEGGGIEGGGIEGGGSGDKRKRNSLC